MNYKELHGFYQDKCFRWTFVSHNGIFVPIISNCKMISLRIHLDNIYNTDTTDIWFSSSKKYNGTMANNNIMILLPKQNQLQVINDNINKKDIIIASEFLLAYKIKSRYQNEIIIGIPNMIPKNELKKIENIRGINNIYVVMETHTTLHNSDTLLSTLGTKYNEDLINVGFSIKDYEIPNTILDNFEDTNKKTINNKVCIA